MSLLPVRYLLWFRLIWKLTIYFPVHISSCGRHLAVLLLNCSRLVIIRDFERAINENTSIYDLALEVQLESLGITSRYLACQNGRIAVATVRIHIRIMTARPHTRSVQASSLFDPIFRMPTLRLRC